MGTVIAAKCGTTLGVAYFLLEVVGYNFVHLAYSYISRKNASENNKERRTVHCERQ